jgi:aromatic-L-amino-acid decarboxylase
MTLGVGEQNVRRIPSDPAYRMIPAALHQAINDDLRSRLLPMAVVATIGTTSTASVDPLEEIAAICREFQMWLHVDAAYGGALGLLPETRHIMSGVEGADSFVVNGHKWLFVPLDFSALYVRNPELLRATFSVDSEYLRGDAERGERNYMDYGVQLGRRFRALKAWMVILSFGQRGLAARIREHLRLARLFASWLEADPLFEIAAPLSMAVVCFRTAPGMVPVEELNDFNTRLVQRLVESGEAYLTRTVLREKVCLRIAIGNVLTTERHLRTVYDVIRREAARLLEQSAPA